MTKENMQRRQLSMYFERAEIFMECLSRLTVRKMLMLQKMNIRIVMKTVAIIKITIGGTGDSFKIDDIVSGARASAIEKVITYTGAIVSRPIAVEVKRASRKSFLTGIFVSIPQIYVIRMLTMNVLGLNGQDER